MNSMKEQTGKDLALRHDPHYLKHRPRGLENWRFWLCVILAGGALIWFVGTALAGNNLPYSKGPTSSSHSFTANHCELCHSEIVNGQRTKHFLQEASNSACLSCHGQDVPDHQKNQVKDRVPTCGSCHVEHRGLVRQVQTPDSQCAGCHGQAQLKTSQDANATKEQKKDPDHDWHRWPFRAEITRFDEHHHPKFSAEAGEFNNPTTIAFSHAAHLNLKDDKGNLVDLQCGYCHRPASETGRWKYSYLKIIDLPGNPKPYPDQQLFPDNGRMIMTMPKYEQSCATSSCHDLTFACNLPGDHQEKACLDDRSLKTTGAGMSDGPEPVPPLETFLAVDHPKSKDDLPKLRGLIQARIDEYKQKYGSLPSLFSDTTGRPMAKLLEKPEESVAKTDQERREAHVKDAEKFLWNARCRFCHQPDSRLPAASKGEVPKPEIPNWDPEAWNDSKIVQRFMPYAVFSHQVHGPIACEGCHVPPSRPHCCEKTKPDVIAQSHDIHMPGIATCVQCHNASPARDGHAENGCFLCHQYHPWNPARQMFRSQHTIEEFTGWKAPEPQPQKGN